MSRNIRTALLGGFAALLSIAPVGAQGPAPTPAPAEAPAAERPAAPRPVQPMAFRSPEDGFGALTAAVAGGDNRLLTRILGSAGDRLIRSGDAVADQLARERFVSAATEKSEILRLTPDRAMLQVGADGWPLPIPMVRRGNSWRFDAAAGTQEIVDRRIGHNELDTIETLRAIAQAQLEYARTAGRQGALSAYARRFFSTPGQRDGLYWPAVQGQPESPLGPLAAAASAGGYGERTRAGAPEPYHGYVFRILESQGPAAPGGAMDYLVNGRLIGGFAILASPARYGSTGIKTFMIGHDGTVWEQDLGPNTAREAAAITSFNPDDGWQKVPE